MDRDFQPLNLYDRYECGSDTDDSTSGSSSPGTKRQLFPSVPSSPDLHSDDSHDSGFCSDEDLHLPVPSGLTRLLRGPLLQSPSLYSTVNLRTTEPSLKRAIQHSPASLKKTKLQPGLRHCKSEYQIKPSNYDNRDLIGDFTKPYCLPAIPGRHSDLRSITPETLHNLIDQVYSDTIQEFVIIDCRYPYEYDGGHIRGALNLYTEDMINEFLDNSRKCSEFLGRGVVLVFHCEFSSERGPKLSRYLRREDRIRNSENYPQLAYPEVYLLHGGYKNFFHHCPEYTTTQQYVTMADKGHSEDLKHFRAKSKSAKEIKAKRRLNKVGLKL